MQANPHSKGSKAIEGAVAAGSARGRIAMGAWAAALERHSILTFTLLHLLALFGSDMGNIPCSRGSA